MPIIMIVIMIIIGIYAALFIHMAQKCNVTGSICLNFRLETSWHSLFHFPSDNDRIFISDVLFDVSTAEIIRVKGMLDWLCISRFSLWPIFTVYVCRIFPSNDFKLISIGCQMAGFFVDWRFFLLDIIKTMRHLSSW